jgi:hypothetical protein
MIGQPGTIGASERGKLRQWKHAAVAKYRLCDQLLHDLEMKRQVNEFAMRGSEAGRRRAFQRIGALVRRFGHLQEVRFTGRAPLALWAALAPRNAVTVNPATEGQKQDCVAVNYVLIGALAGPGIGGMIADGLWSIEISDHALLRVLQRDPAADLAAVLFGVHRSALLLPNDIAEEVDMAAAAGEGRASGFLVSAGDGVFICEFNAATDRSNWQKMLGVRAVTWLHNDQLRDDQRPEPEGRPGDRLGEGLLLPVPLRRVLPRRSPGDPFGFRVEVHRWVGSFGQPELRKGRLEEKLASEPPRVA